MTEFRMSCGLFFFQFLLHTDLRDSLFYTHEAPKTNDNNSVLETACVNIE